MYVFWPKPSCWRSFCCCSWGFCHFCAQHSKPSFRTWKILREKFVSPQILSSICLWHILKTGCSACLKTLQWIRKDNTEFSWTETTPPPSSSESLSSCHGCRGPLPSAEASTGIPDPSHFPLPIIQFTGGISPPSHCYSSFPQPGPLMSATLPQHFIRMRSWMLLICWESMFTAWDLLLSLSCRLLH